MSKRASNHISFTLHLPHAAAQFAAADALGVLNFFYDYGKHLQNILRLPSMTEAQWFYLLQHFS